jgi:iron complex transport system ATP-binding protein
MIQFEHIAIGYSDVLLRSAFIELEAGKVYALIGRNGIGKSTLLQSLTGIVPLKEGTIRLLNDSLETLSRLELVKRIAVVESRFEGLEYLKVKDYIALGRTPHTDSFGNLKQQDLAVIHEIAGALGILALMDKFTDQISDGERQLCAVARAFVQETPMIILDEPTAFLDYLNRKKLLTILVELARDQQKCILLSTHDLELCIQEKVPMLLASSGKLSLHEQLTLDEVLNEMSKY